MVKRFIVLCIMLVLGLAIAGYAADKPKDDPKPPTERELLLEKRNVLVERTEKLDAQFRLIQAQFVLCQQELARVVASIKALDDAAKKDPKKKD